MGKGDSRDIQIWQESCRHTWFGGLEMGYKIFAQVYNRVWKGGIFRFDAGCRCQWFAQGWRSGESAHLPPMCPGFASRTRRHMWVVCCWFFTLLRDVFLRVLRFSPLLKNHHFQIPIGLITVFDSILTDRQSGQKLQCLYRNPIANNFIHWIFHNLWIKTLK